MNRGDVIRGFVVGLSLLSFTACTTLQPIEDFTPSKISQDVRVGDRVQIVWRSGVAFDLEVTAIDADALHGRTAAGKQYKMLFEGIRSISVEKRRGWQTGTAFGAVLTVGVIIFLLGLFKAWDPGGWDPGGGGGGESGGKGSGG